jgi:hypothetical protein
MTPAEQSAYDSYVPWLTHLTQACMAINALPLDELLTANVRMALVGAHVGPDHTEAVNTVSLQRQRLLIEKAIEFRNALRAPGPADPAGPPPTA